MCKEVPKQAQSQHAQSQHAQFARETTSQAGTHNSGSQVVTSASSLVNGADQEEDGSTRQGYSDWVTTTQEINGPVLQSAIAVAAVNTTQSTVSTNVQHLTNGSPGQVPHHHGV